MTKPIFDALIDKKWQKSIEKKNLNHILEARFSTEYTNKYSNDSKFIESHRSSSVFLSVTHSDKIKETIHKKHC